MTKIIEDVNVLKQMSVVETDAKEVQAIIEKLENELKNSDIGIGLSAIQIGIPKRIFVIKDEKNNETNFLHFINPEVMECDGEFVFPGEGCLSFPGLYLNAKRFYHYTIKNQVIENDKYREEVLYFYYPEQSDERIKRKDAITSIAVQHEMDHLNGRILPEFGFKNIPIKSNAKVGRNDPCPCGSGKKYKKCCSKN